MDYEVEHRAIAIGIVGPGLVGKTLIAQLAEQVAHLPYRLFFFDAYTRMVLEGKIMLMPGILISGSHAMQADRLLEEWGLELQVCGITDSRWMLLSYEKLDLSTWQSALDKQVWKPSAFGAPILTDSLLYLDHTMAGIFVEYWIRSSFLLQETEANLDSFTYHFASIRDPADKIIIDCTASTAVPCFYQK